MTDTLTHATTVPQPRAWAAAAGYCPVLMSDTRPPMEHEGQLLGIHASSQRFWPGSTRMQEFVAGLGRALTADEEALSGTRRALIGVARVVGVIRRQCSMDPRQMDEYIPCIGRSLFGRPVPRDLRDRIRPWWRSGSKWGLLLMDAVLLPEPIPVRGAGGVWRITGGTTDGNGMNAAWALEQWRKARGA